METQNKQNSKNLAIGIDFGNKAITVAMWNPKKRAPELIANLGGQSKPITPSITLPDSTMKQTKKETPKEQPKEKQMGNSTNDNNKQDSTKNQNENQEEEYDFGNANHLMLIEEVIKFDKKNNRKYPKQPNYEPYYHKEQPQEDEEENQYENDMMYNDELDVDNQNNPESNTNCAQKVQKEIKDYPPVTVRDLKKLIAEKLTSHYITENASFLPYEFDVDENENLCIKYAEGLYPISSLLTSIFSSIKSTIESAGYAIELAVISVPQFFSNSQRISIKENAMNAGINNVHILNEPTAATMYYRIKNTPKKQQDIMVVDYGSSKLDVSLMRITKGRIFNVMKTTNDFTFGNAILVDTLFSFVYEEYKNTYHTCDELISKDNILLLRQKCEEGVNCIMARKDAEIVIEKFDGNNDLNVTITPETFDDINKDNYQYLEEQIESLFEEQKEQENNNNNSTVNNNKTKKVQEEKSKVDNDKAKNKDQNEIIKKEQIEAVILIGEVFKLPKIQEIITKKFDCEIITDYYNAIAFGDAIYAAQLCNQIPKDVLPQFTAYNLTPLTLGIRTEGDLMSTIIKRGLRYPLKARKNFITTYDYQTLIKFEVYEGERKLAKHNKLLYRKKLTNLPAKLRGEVKIDVIFTIDNDGILVVSVSEGKEGKKIQIGNYTPEEIMDKIKEAEMKSEDDTREEERIKAKNKLNDTIFKLSHSELACYEEGRTEIELAKNWMKHNEKAKKEDYVEKEKELIAFFEGKGEGKEGKNENEDQQENEGEENKKDALEENGEEKNIKKEEAEMPPQ